MLLRIWKVPLAPDKGRELERFAACHSKPMFRDLSGCQGAFFARSESHAVTVTVWSDEAALSKAEGSSRYQQVVSQIEQSGILEAGGSTEVLTLYGGLIDGSILESLNELGR